MSAIRPGRTMFVISSEGSCFRFLVLLEAFVDENIYKMISGNCFYMSQLIHSLKKQNLHSSLYFALKSL